MKFKNAIKKPAQPVITVEQALDALFRKGLLLTSAGSTYSGAVQSLPIISLDFECMVEDHEKAQQMHKWISDICHPESLKKKKKW